MKRLLKPAVRASFAIVPLWTAYVVRMRIHPLLRALRRGVARFRATRGNMMKVRRYTHMLEKGIAMPERRRVFGERYIGELVEELGLLARTCDAKELSWTVAVLHHYFAVCEPTPTVRAAHESFLALRLHNHAPHAVPYAEHARPASEVTYDALHALAQRRRSVRHFLAKPVPADAIEHAMDIARYAPSACNRQSFRLHCVSDPERAHAITRIPGGASGYRVPCVLVMIAQYRGYAEERDILSPVIDASLCVSHLLYALETVGLSSVCINWPQITAHDRKIRRLVRLEDDECVLMLIGIGYADPQGLIPYSDKRAVSDLLTFGV